jgi:signal transduction histidine kinase/DNA-binding response OmpR family regulator/HAMP domain-containing protein
MKLNDRMIGTQLSLGLGVILLFVVVIGVSAWIQTNELHLQTRELYDHSLIVSRALGRLEADVESMSLHVRDLFLAEDHSQFEASQQMLEIKNSEAGRLFPILYDRHLGPRNDIVTLEEAFLRWKVLRDETIRMLQAGKTAEAEARIRPGGVQAVQGEIVRSRLQKVNTIALYKADEFYDAATTQTVLIHRQLIGLVTVILLLFGIIAWRLLSGVKGPLAALTTATAAFRQGKLDARCGYASANEFGTLAASFNALADQIQTEMKIRTQAAELADVMLRNDDAHAFCHELLKTLLQHTASQMGAVYFLNDAKTTFKLFDSIGLGAGERATFSAAELEGELGAALASHRIEHIVNIPAETRFTFATANGDLRPRAILTIPVLADHTVSAVISLASVQAYEAPALRLVNDVWRMLTARVNGVLTFRATQELAKRLDQQNHELDAQKRELLAQAAELTVQNAELDVQKRQLDESNRMKRAFLSNMSHELRTPLNSVIALSGVLHRRLADAIPAEEYGYIEIIERNGKNLLALINAILDLSRIEAGHTEVSVGRCSVRELVCELVEMLAQQAIDKNIALLNHVPGDLPVITSDADKLRHILQNLVGNALKFTEQGRVAITAAVRHSEMRIDVSDTGIGIEADQIPHLFEAFRQADDSASRKYGGAGLGLAIAKEHAQLIGGRITVESAPGQGSVFTLWLPLEWPADGARTWPDTAARTEAVEHVSLAPPAGAAPIRGQGQRILVVEDNESAILQLTDLLMSEGYQVQVACNGQVALEQIAQAPPAAMILDLMMPEVDGFHVLKAVRGKEQTAHLPVLILTAKHVTREELSFLTSNHVQQLITKGDINKAGLLAAVARMVAAPPAAPVLTSHRRRPARPGKPMVLLVEDNRDNLCTARALLEDRYQIIEALDGREGLEQARAHRPDVILMDVALPVMDGLEALAAIRADESLRHTPVIAATASAMKGDRETILSHGFDGYISKPLDAELLRKMLGEALDYEVPHG